MSASATIHSPHLRKPQKKLEARVHEFAATPVLLSLADRRLRTQSHSSAATVLGTEFHTSLPAGLALYRQLIATITKLGMSVQLQQQGQPPLAHGGAPGVSLLATDRHPTPPPHIAAAAANNNSNSSSNNALSGVTAAAVTTSTTPVPAATGAESATSAATAIGFGVHASDPPMVAQGKLLEAWAAFLGGERRRISRMQAQAAQQATSEIARQVDAKYGGSSSNSPSRSTTAINNSSPMRQFSAARDDEDKRDSTAAAAAAHKAAVTSSFSSASRPVLPSSNTSKREDADMYQKQREADNRASDSTPILLLCEVAVPGLEYPAVVMRALEREESERNPRAELELYVQHFESLLRRGEASSQGTIRDLETSVFVTMTQSLLSLVPLAVPKPAASPRGGSASAGAVMRRRAGTATSCSTGGGGAGEGGGSGNASGAGSRVATPLGQPISAMDQRRPSSSGHGAIWRPGSSRPGSAASFMTTAAGQQQQQQQPQQLLPASSSAATSGGRVPSAGLGTNTPIPAPPTSAPSNFQHLHDQIVLQQIQQREAEITEHGSIPTGATMTVARAVCRPNSAVHLQARRSYPRALGRFVSEALHTTAQERLAHDREEEHQRHLEAMQLTDEQIVQMQLDRMQQRPQRQQESPPRDSGRKQQPSGGARSLQNQAPVYNSHRTHMLSARAHNNNNKNDWQRGEAAAAVGVGAAAKSVTPTTSGWTGGHKVNAAPRLDTRRPRHGKATQPDEIAARMMAMMQGSAEFVSKHDGVAAAASNTAGIHLAPSSARVVQHAAAAPSLFSSHSDQGWVLASPSPPR